MNSNDVVPLLNSMWHSKKYNYPGPQPVSIERKHFDTLKSNAYYIGHKNDGERIALCCLRYENKPRCFLLNRKLEIYPISLLVSKKLYDGTILDCEIVNDTIFIFDCPLFGGVSLKTKPFSERMTFADAFIAGYKKRPEDKYDIQVKQFVLRQNYQKLDVCDASDGYVLVPENKHVQMSTHNFYFKWKPLLKNTIDFAVNRSKQVFLQNAGKLCKAQNVNVDVSNISFTDELPLILECQYLHENNWIALHERKDKIIPNSLYTYKRTLVNIEENIHFEELVT